MVRTLDHAAVQRITGLRVTDLEYYRNAFTHKSYAVRSNERIEFVGDAILSAIVSEHLFDTYPDADEGALSKMRIRIVNGKTLSQIGKTLGVSEYIRMNEKGLSQGWNENPRILEDVVESLIGAVYLDLGLHAARSFVHRKILASLTDEDVLVERNYKDVMIRWAKSDAAELDYACHDETGAGKRRFHVVLSFRGSKLAEGFGSTKKEAEQMAAKTAATCLDLLVKEG